MLRWVGLLVQVLGVVVGVLLGHELLLELGELWIQTVVAASLKVVTVVQFPSFRILAVRSHAVGLLLEAGRDTCFFLTLHWDHLLAIGILRQGHIVFVEGLA